GGGPAGKHGAIRERPGGPDDGETDQRGRSGEPAAAAARSWRFVVILIIALLIGRVLLLAVAFLGILVVQQVVRILVVLVLMAVVVASIASVASVVIGRPVGWLRLRFGMARVCTAARVRTGRV